MYPKSASIILACAAALLFLMPGASIAGVTGPAGAASKSLATSNPLVEKVHRRWRGYRRFYRHRHYRPYYGATYGYYYRPYYAPYYRPYYYRPYYGPYYRSYYYRPRYHYRPRVRIYIGF